MSHFGVSTNLISVSVLFLALLVAIIGFAAKEAISDTVSGFLILADQPFRGGDEILIPELGNTGTVQTIGLRSTRVLMGDNREVIAPNSVIGSSQIVNYSYPDPSLRLQFDFTAEGGDLEELRDLIVETVRGVDWVLPHKPVDAHYVAFGGRGRTLRVRYWVESSDTQSVVRTAVFLALEKALAEEVSVRQARPTTSMSNLAVAPVIRTLEFSCSKLDNHTITHKLSCVTVCTGWGRFGCSV